MRSRSANCSADGADHDQESFLKGDSSPTLFTSAALNFGVNQLLDNLVRLALPPAAKRMSTAIGAWSIHRSVRSSSFRPG